MDRPCAHTGLSSQERAWGALRWLFQTAPGGSWAGSQPALRRAGGGGGAGILQQARSLAGPTRKLDGRMLVSGLRPYRRDAKFPGLVSAQIRLWAAADPEAWCSCAADAFDTTLEPHPTACCSYIEKLVNLLHTIGVIHIFPRRGDSVTWVHFGTVHLGIANLVTLDPRVKTTATTQVFLKKRPRNIRRRMSPQGTGRQLLYPETSKTNLFFFVSPASPTSWLAN